MGDHAEPAEPKSLAEKVMSKIEGKNTFIGICTKRERTIDDSLLTPVRRQPAFRKAKESDFQWKTSDWILQEIGLAKGRGLAIVLLVEEGLRVTSGLQGDVEYIPFVREAPEKSWGKILEMFTALSPKPSTGLPMAPEVKSTDTTPKQAPTPSPEEPKPDWKRDDYERAMFWAILEDRTAEAETINTAYLATPEAGINDNADTWKARNERWRLIFGKGGSLAKLKALVDNHPHNAKILEELAQVLEEYRDYAEAARTYEASSKETSDVAEQKRLLGQAALQYAAMGELNKTAEIIRGLRAAVGAGTVGELGLLLILSKLAEHTKEDEVLIAIMERIVEVTPDDFGARFSLAYKHSEIGNNDMALHHYLRIPDAARKGMTWNNLGVSFQVSDACQISRSISASRGDG